jgi:hypothetical protein
MKRALLSAAMWTALVAGCGGGGSTPSTPDGGGTPDAGYDTDYPVPPGSPQAPVVPKLENLKVAVQGDRVSVSFQGVAGALDYRIYPLPAAADVSVASDGHITVRGATYRCAGDRLANPVVADQEPGQTAGWVTAQVNATVEGFARTESTGALLGYAYLAPGDGRVAVQALGDSAHDADNDCGTQVWRASRAKRYTASTSERDTLLAAAFRDDGVVFYAPTQGDVTVMTAFAGKSRLYFTGAEATARASLQPAAAFQLLSAPAAGTTPVYRVYVNNGCGQHHDELAAGRAEYLRVLHQGNQAMTDVQWSGLSTDLVLVVEALDAGCPFQGHLSAAARPATGNAQPFVTIADVRASAPTGEVFLNGQHDPASRPKAIARSYLKLSPSAPPAMEWSDGFETSTPATFTEVAHENRGYWDVQLSAPGYDAQYYSIEPGEYALGVVGGELWTSMADWGSDTPGKFRLTPRQKATFSASAFVHATMMTDVWSTNRRYPQLWISDQPSPVQDNLASGTTLIVQSRGIWPGPLELQLCAKRTWDVNNQCPGFHFDHKAFSSDPLTAHDVPGDTAAPMHLQRVDLWASASRAYVFLDGRPYGCANLPSAPAAGPVTVTFGDVLYHSGVDEPVVAVPTSLPFIAKYQLTETRRHFDNLGFDSGVAAPPWDEGRFPCLSQLEPN